MVDDRLALDLFGSFRAAVYGTPLTGFRSDKARALLAYLAVEGDRPHSRSSLATLLWPDMPDAAALGNLRKTLHRLQETLGPTDRPVLVVTRQAIALNRAACITDVTTFRDLLAETEAHRHANLHECDVCLDRLARAAALYRGELLAGFSLPDAEPFDEWLVLRRERFLHAALGALYRLTAANLERAEYDRALAHAVHQVELDPGREEAHVQAIHALLRSGQRTQARAYLERARETMMDALGVDLSPDTLALLDERDTIGAGAAPPRQSVRHYALPVQLTPFFGRRRELTEIAAFLSEPGCRLVSIVGPGGMGKTRLAIRVAEERLGRFADGVAFIALGEVRLPALLSAALLAGLGLQPDARTDPRTHLLQYLGHRECLLVLDRFEHLLERTDLLVDILTSAPNVRVLVTSQLPLGLFAEQRVPLAGLDFPHEIGDVATREREIADAGSVQLFVRAARRIDPSFLLTPEHAYDVLRISRSVEGMPLALELAASWIGTLSAAAIAEAVEDSPGSLITEAQDVPDRQRSIDSVLAQAWALLPPHEQDTLARLSVFGGSFDLEAAVQIADASTVELAILLDRALLHRAANGRYQLHELLRQFAETAAAGVPDVNLEAVRARHCTYYLGFVAAAETALYGADPRPAVEAIVLQHSGLEQAWSWAAERGEAVTLVAALEGVARFWELACEFETAETLLALAAGAVERRLQGTPQSDDGMNRLLVRLRVSQAHFAERRDRVDEAIAVAEIAMSLAENTDDDEGVAMARSACGEALPHRQEFSRAAEQLQLACTYFEDHDQPRQLARALRRLATVQWRSGEYGPTVESLQRARDLQEKLGDAWEQAQIYYALGGVAFEQGSIEEARVNAESALRLYAASGDRRNTAWLQGNLGLVYQMLGQFERALQYNQHHVATSRELGDLKGLAIALGNRGATFAAAGQGDEAWAAFEEALEIAQRMENGWEAARHRTALAGLAHLRGEWDLALAHFEQALPVLRAGQALFYVVEPLLAAAELQLDRGEISAAAELAREGGNLAQELGLRDEIIRSRVLEARLAVARGERESGLQLLQELLDGAEDETHRAMLHFELWRVCREPTHGEESLRLYRRVYERTPHHRYRSRIEELTPR